MRNKKLFKILIVLILVIIILNIKNFIKPFYPIKYYDYVMTYSKKYDIDPYIVWSVIKAESNFDERAQSHKNAMGLMQITIPTANWIAEKMRLVDFSEKKLFNPETNISMGCWYLNNLSSEFKGDMDLVLAAYNGGRGNVNKWLSSHKYSKNGKTLYYIPFKETDEYVKKVNVNYKIYLKLYGEKNIEK